MYMASEWCNRHCWYCFRWEAAIDDFVQLLADEHFSACKQSLSSELQPPWSSQ